MFHYFILFIALGFALWLIFKIVVFGASLWKPPAELVIVPFEGSDSNKTQAPAILSAKLRELKTRAKTTPAGYGLLSVPLLKSGPQEADQTANKTLAELDKIQLKVKDVDVSALIKMFDALLAPERYELRGNVVELPTSLSVICQLVRGERVVASWEASTKINASGSATSAGAAGSKSSLDDLLDQVLYQMIFDFAENKELKKDWGISIAEADRFTNWQSLRAYIRGLRALRAYQETLDPSDLKEASEFFDSLTITDPSNPYGLYFRGLALSEDRREAEAVEAFRQLQRLLERQKKPKEWSAMMREARLNEATTRLKLYTMDEASKAVKILSELIGELDKELKPSTTTDTKSDTSESNKANPKVDSNDLYTKKLLTVCYAQLAYTHGTILSFLRYQPSTDDPNDHATKMQDNLTQANQTFDSVGASWAPREKMDVRFRIDNARGYGLYRDAFFQQQKKPEDDTIYKKLCGEAITSLEKANEERPNHYEVIQNLAMIYADKDYDDTGNSLAQAKWLFERTKKFVPNDFYQYDQLATIHLRLMELCSTDECRNKEIDAGINEAKTAINLRMESVGALQTLSLLAIKKWEINKRDGSAATGALDAIRNRIGFAVDDPIFKKFTDFLSSLAETRESSATQLNDLVEQVLYLVRIPKLADARKQKLKDFGLAQLDKSLELTKDSNKSENKEPHSRAEQLKAELNAIK